ncbi:hypothetical protein B0T25DRAFT_542642 [Lasiosphaeria hispida]|uniref:BTB domain-containing protein n=1 Tax=Lasiosphaeria hispida TaxID=260671 RepID=A0AAJ0HHD3_9PEZI|nr:hypothetical protein B0T25DRAFT_542642 [Lasiosphaeria hispida]
MTANGKVDYESFLTSKPFKIIVGPEKKEFHIHSGLLSQQSEPLNVLVNGPMKEATRQQIEWPDIDVSTFVRFSQWAYSGNYTNPGPLITTDESKDGQIETLQVGDQPKIIDSGEELFASPSKNLKGRKGHKGKNLKAATPSPIAPVGPFSLVSWPGVEVEIQVEHNNVWGGCPTTRVEIPKHSVRDCAYCGMNPIKMGKKIASMRAFVESADYPPPQDIVAYRPQPNGSCEDYSDTMLCHASLYVLGDQYNITLLQQLALHKLHTTLQHFVLHPARLDAIPKLVNYVWNNTMPTDKLRNLVLTYCACIAEDLIKYFPAEFESLVEDIPEFASGLMANILLRLT